MNLLLPVLFQGTAVADMLCERIQKKAMNRYTWFADEQPQGNGL
jgi:hypothetical protein